MLQSSRQGLVGLFGRLSAVQCGDLPAAACVGLRHLTTSSAVYHVQPATMDESLPASAQEPGRWRRELGAIRTDWT
jgi:hypothetical protein